MIIVTLTINNIFRKQNWYIVWLESKTTGNTDNEENDQKYCKYGYLRKLTGLLHYW